MHYVFHIRPFWIKALKRRRTKWRLEFSWIHAPLKSYRKYPWFICFPLHVWTELASRLGWCLWIYRRVNQRCLWRKASRRIIKISFMMFLTTSTAAGWPLAPVTKASRYYCGYSSASCSYTVYKSCNIKSELHSGCKTQRWPFFLLLCCCCFLNDRYFRLTEFYCTRM